MQAWTKLFPNYQVGHKRIRNIGPEFQSLFYPFYAPQTARTSDLATKHAATSRRLFFFAPSSRPSNGVQNRTFRPYDWHLYRICEHPRSCKPSSLSTSSPTFRWRTKHVNGKCPERGSDDGNTTVTKTRYRLAIIKVGPTVVGSPESES